MSELAPLVNAQYGLFYVARRDEDETVLELAASYGAEGRDELKPAFRLREGLVGQAAADKRPILLEHVPGDFVRIGSGLGHASPANVNILPALFEDEVKAVIELASFSEFNETHQNFLDQLMESVGIVLNTIAATMRTEGLLKQSQLLTQELQARQTELTTKQEELHNTNEELQEKAQLLENEKRQVEAKNREIEMARLAVEEKAEQLEVTSKYKSEFLANMSHELRTPLNSLLILSKLLADNPQGNLNAKQTEFARTINSAVTILVVDDHDAVRATTHAMLEQLGHKILSASTGSEALCFLDRQADDIDLIVTDYAMPNMSGIELIHRAREIRPDIPAVIVTGYGGADIGQRPEDVAVVSKPFNAVQLQNAVDQAALVN